MDDLLRDEEGRLASLRRLNVLKQTDDGRFDDIVMLACQLLDLPKAAVSFVDQDRQCLWSPTDLGVRQTLRSDSFCDVTIKQRAPFVVSDTWADDRFRHNPFVTGDEGVRSYVGAPLIMADGYQVGALCGYDVKPRAFSHVDLAMLSCLAQRVVRELELCERAETDELTGLLRRGAFFARVDDRLAEACGGTQEPAALAVLDLDHFKRINDQFGHSAGDEVLRALAPPFADLLAAPCSIGRVGGEEFAALLPGHTSAQAEATLDDVRQRVAQLRLSAVDCAPITISIGFAMLEEGIDDKTWYRRADAALYAAKQAGRNVTVRFAPDRHRVGSANAATLPFIETLPKPSPTRQEISRSAA